MEPQESSLRCSGRNRVAYPLGTPRRTVSPGGGAVKQNREPPSPSALWGTRRYDPGVRDNVVVAVGTAKGAFLWTTDGLSEPLFPGEQVPALAIDTRTDPPRLLAGATSAWWGPSVRTSEDLGRTWSDPATRELRFPAGTDAAMVQIWQLSPSSAAEPDTVYAGVEPAALFRSDDGARSWSLVRGLWDHPHRPQWQPGFGGLGLHTVLVDPRDPERLLVAISAGGVYRSADRGATWGASNTGLRLGDRPDDYPEFGQCVHKVARDAADPDRLYMQNHLGVYRSDDGGGAWNEISEGLPSIFGFPVVAHPGTADVAFVLPLQAAEARWSPDGEPRVYRTRDAGRTWIALGSGLPPPRAYLTILRDAFCTDGADPAGLYFGTRSGQVYASFDDGESWDVLAEHLPPVLCVRAAPLP
jgi:hypothetical protein